MSNEDFDFDIDFGNVKPFESLPTGDYKVVISDAVLQKTKKRADRFNLVVSLEVEEPTEFEGKSFKAWIYIDPENPWGLQAFAQAATGIEELTTNINMRSLIEEIVGNTVGVTMEQTTDTDDNGKETTLSSPKGWFIV